MEHRKIKSTSIVELKNVLTEEIMLYERYATQLKSDMDLMVHLKMDDLETSNKAKATVLLKIQALEEARKKLVHRIAQEKGIQKEKVRITDICESIGTEQGSILLKLRERLHGVMANIRGIQDDASNLVVASLRWVDSSMNNLKHLLDPSGTYNAYGRVGKSENFAGTVVESKA